MKYKLKLHIPGGNKISYTNKKNTHKRRINYDFL